jgi:hypothetical protein
MAANTYKVTAPKPVLDAEPGETFTHEFTPDEEADLIAAGRVEIVPSEFRVVGGSTVHGAEPGKTFKAAIPLGPKNALIDAGHIEQLAEKPAGGGKKVAADKPKAESSAASDKNKEN